MPPRVLTEYMSAYCQAASCPLFQWLGRSFSYHLSATPNLWNLKSNYTKFLRTVSRVRATLFQRNTLKVIINLWFTNFTGSIFSAYSSLFLTTVWDEVQGRWDFEKGKFKPNHIVAKTKNKFLITDKTLDF